MGVKQQLARRYRCSFGQTISQTLGRLLAAICGPSDRPESSYAIEMLEDRIQLSAYPIITEFMAWKTTGTGTSEQDAGGWVEIYNPGATQLNLLGYYLTDNNDNPTKWQFPSTSVSPGSYLLVYTKDNTTSGLHTTFEIDHNSGYLGLIAPDGNTIVSEYNYPDQEKNVSYGVPITPGSSSLIAAGANLTYLVPTGDIGSGWNGSDPAFNDSSWATGTSGIGFDDTLANEVEPNGDIGSATMPGFSNYTGFLYQLGIKGTLTDTSDEDWYKIGAMQNGDVLTVSVSGSNSKRGAVTDPNVELWRYNGGSPILVKSDTDSGPGYDALIYRQTVTTTTADTYYVRMPKTATSGAYDVGVWLENVSTAPTTGSGYLSEVESNNTSATAQDASSGWRTVQYQSIVSGSISTSDVDYFAYNLANNDVVTVQVASTSMDTRVTLLDSTGTTIKALDDGTSVLGSTGDSAIYSFAVTSAGKYYIKVESSNGSTGTYQSQVYLSSTTPPTAPFANDISTNISGSMFGTNSSVYIRMPFAINDADAVDTLRLRIKYDDGFAAYVNGHLIVRATRPPRRCGIPPPPRRIRTARRWSTKTSRSRSPPIC